MYKKTKFVAWLYWTEGRKKKFAMHRVYEDVSGHFYVKMRGLYRLVDLLKMQGFMVNLYEF